MLSTVKFVCQQLFLTCYHTMLKCLFVNKFNANCEISHFVKSGPTNPTLPYTYLKSMSSVVAGLERFCSRVVFKGLLSLPLSVSVSVFLSLCLCVSFCLWLCISVSKRLGGCVCVHVNCHG